ncbi:MAG: hypothetical protein JXI43_01960 [Tissierellales bacterium]|nr:hypothetical protein [Tissierellales bacterium]
MIRLNENNYKLTLLDTCVVSELLKRRGSKPAHIIEMIYDGSIPCFSTYTLKELKNAQDLYDDFFNTFGALPSFAIMDHHQILEEEIKAYNSSNEFNIIITAIFDNPFSNNNLNVKAMTDSFLTKNYMKKFEEDKNQILDGILSLKQNYPPKNKKYTIKEIDEFVNIVAFEQLCLQCRDWVKPIVDSGTEVNMDQFNSLKMMAYVVFYKFYIDNRTPRLSDIPDFIISSSYPYLDQIIIEKNQAEMIRQIQKRHNFCNHLNIFTLKDF